MIKSVTITNFKEETLKIELANPWPSGLIIERIEGLGPPQINVNVTELATTDGGTYNSSKGQSRNIVFTFRFIDFPTIEDSRHLTYRYFPLKRPVQLSFETTNRTLVITGYVESNEPDIFSSEEGCTISLLCPDPWFYAGGDDKTVFSGVIPRFEFPFPPLELAPITPQKMARSARVVSDGVVQILYPVDGATASSLSFPLVFKVGDISLKGQESVTIDHTVQHTGVYEYNDLDSGYEASTVVTFEAPGKHVIEVTVGGATPVMTTFRIDLSGPPAQRPICWINYPENGQKMLRGRFRLDYTVMSQMDVPVSSSNVTAKIDGKALILGSSPLLLSREIEAVDGALNQHGWRFVDDVSLDSNGTHTIEISAINEEGDLSDVVTATITSGGDLNEFGEIVIDTTVNFFYEGDVDTGIVANIHIMGPTNKIVIYNVDTHTRMTIDTTKIAGITGAQLGIGEDIIVSTVTGDKYVKLLREGEYFNIMGCVDKNSDWFSLTPGWNAFDFSADDGEGNIMISFYYRNAYGGI